MIQRAVVTDVRVSDAQITFALEDGRELSAPTMWSERLSRASRAEREAFEIGSDGMIVTWPTLDEHIGVWSLLGVSEEDVFKVARLRVATPLPR
jgi:hypothetical protein